MTTEKKPAEQKAKALPALTTAAGRFGARTDAAGVIIEAVPADVLQAQAAWLNADTDKVRAAREAGAATVRYRA